MKVLVKITENPLEFMLSGDPIGFLCFVLFGSAVGGIGIMVGWFVISLVFSIRA